MLERESIRRHGAKVLLSVASCLCATDATSQTSGDALARQTEYGISLALAGNVAAAESVFVSILAVSTDDARALNNLGNLAFLDAELEVAVVFYGMALENAPNDNGVRLNRALALLLRGDDELARAEAARAMTSGNEAEVFELLGLEVLSEDDAGHAAEGAAINAKAADKAMQLSRAEVQDLLREAMRSIQPDSLHADSLRVPTSYAPGDTGSGARRAKRRTWRSAAPRSADQWDPTPWLYWKRD